MKYLEITIVWFGILMLSAYLGKGDDGYGPVMVAFWAVVTAIYIWIMIKTARGKPRR